MITDKPIDAVQKVYGVKSSNTKKTTIFFAAVGVLALIAIVGSGLAFHRHCEMFASSSGEFGIRFWQGHGPFASVVKEKIYTSGYSMPSEIPYTEKTKIDSNGVYDTFLLTKVEGVKREFEKLSGGIEERQQRMNADMEEWEWW